MKNPVTRRLQTRSVQGFEEEEESCGKRVVKTSYRSYPDSICDARGEEEEGGGKGSFRAEVRWTRFGRNGFVEFGEAMRWTSDRGEDSLKLFGNWRRRRRRGKWDFVEGMALGILGKKEWKVKRKNETWEKKIEICTFSWRRFLIFWKRRNGKWKGNYWLLIEARICWKRDNVRKK